MCFHWPKCVTPFPDSRLISAKWEYVRAEVCVCVCVCKNQHGAQITSHLRIHNVQKWAWSSCCCCISGDLVTFDNWRLLHGRRSYVSSPDRLRHLEGAYLDWDEVMSRLRILRHAVHGNAWALETLPNLKRQWHGLRRESNNVKQLITLIWERARGKRTGISDTRSRAQSLLLK